MFSDARNHAINAIGKVLVQELPFPHFLCKDIFPEKFYQDILDRLPDKDSYHSIVGSGRIETKGMGDITEPYKNRLIITLTKDVVGNFAKKDQTFWLETIRLLKNSDLMRGILGKI